MSESGSFKNLLKHSKNYFTADIASKGLGLISIPLFTRMLDTAEYGIYNVYAAYAGLVSVILTLNAHTAVGRYFYEAEDDFKQFFGTSVIVVLGVISVSAVLIFIFQRSVGSLLGLPVNLILLMIPYTIVETCFSFFMQIFQPKRESGLIARVNIIRAYSVFGMSVILLLIIKNDKYMAIIWAQLIAGGCIAYYLMLKMRVHFVLNYSIKHVKYICCYSLPLLFYTLNGVILNQADRVMINRYCGPSDTGIYSLSYNLGMIISLISGALLAAWTPNYFENMETKNYSKMRSEIRNILNIMTCFSVALILFGKEFGMILSPVKYHAGLIVLPVITVGCFFNSAWHLYGRHFIVSKKTYYITYLGILSALVNIGLNALFIPMYGYKVAAYTTLFSFIFMLIMSVLVTKYIIKIYPVTIKLMIRPVLFMLSAIFVFSSLEMITVNIVAKIIIKFVILMLMLYLSNIKFINLRLINKI